MHENRIEMYSAQNEGKFFVVERCRSIWLQYQKCVINKLDKVVDKYNNTHHRTIKMKSSNVKLHILTIVLSIMRKNLNSKLEIM